MKPNKIEIAFGVLFLCVGLAFAAEAPKADPKPAPTIESVTKELENAKADNAQLKAQIAQFKAALDKAIEQRNKAQDDAVNAAANAAKP